MYEDENIDEEMRERDERDSYSVRSSEAAAERSARAALESVRYHWTSNSTSKHMCTLMTSPINNIS